ncbi:MAG: hypothetical protein ACLTX3_02920 [Lachnospiraceae bacterium]
MYFFWIGVGMLIQLLIPTCVWTVLIAAALMIIGYNLFCSC